MHFSATNGRFGRTRRARLVLVAIGVIAVALSVLVVPGVVAQADEPVVPDISLSASPAEFTAGSSTLGVDALLHRWAA